MAHDNGPELVVANASEWSRWLDVHEADSAGIWLVLAKKGTHQPTSLTYNEALEIAICHGWVDGQLAQRDGRTFRRKFTPRRRGSAWSKRNVAIATKLSDESRMKPAGLAAVQRAQLDGSWDRAYDPRWRFRRTSPHPSLSFPLPRRSSTTLTPPTDTRSSIEYPRRSAPKHESGESTSSSPCWLEARQSILNASHAGSWRTAASRRSGTLTRTERRPPVRQRHFQ